MRAYSKFPKFLVQFDNFGQPPPPPPSGAFAPCVCIPLMRYLVVVYTELYFTLENKIKNYAPLCAIFQCCISSYKNHNSTNSAMCVFRSFHCRGSLSWSLQALCR